jgi:hypothetical protein
MLVGVGLALKQHNAKRLLAYHSISQNLTQPELPRHTLLTHLERLLMRWDHAGALWLAFGALLILTMLGGRGG